MVSSIRVGIDPGIRQCVAVSIDGDGRRCGRPQRFRADRPGVERFITQLNQRFPEAPRRFFIEASGLYWYAPTGLLREHGESVSLISPSYTKAQRKATSPRAKSDVRDAEALARASFSLGDKAMHDADLPEGQRLNLRMLCRQRKTLRDDATGIKLRIFAWLQLATPGLADVLDTDLSPMDRDFIERYPVVARATRLGPKRLLEFLQRRSDDEAVDELVDKLFKLAQDAYAPRGLDDQTFAWQIGLELKRLELIELQLREIDRKTQQLLPQCDPRGLARSIPGFGPVVAAIIVAEAGTDLSRFASPNRFASWTGLVAKARGSAGKQLDGLPITKAGRGIVKWALYIAANSARLNDPNLAELYARLRDKGKHHNVALGAVAHKLARCYWAVMTYQQHYKTQPQEPLDGS
jgi:transposase